MKLEKRRKKKKHSSKFNKAKLNGKNEVVLTRKSLKALLLPHQFRKAVWTRSGETFPHRFLQSLQISSHGDMALCDKAGTEQANISLHWLFPPFANKLENSTALLTFPPHDVQARSWHRHLQSAAFPGRTALVRLREGGSQDHTNGEVWQTSWALYLHHIMLAMCV